MSANPPDAMPPPGDRPDARSANRRTGLALASIAAVFFVGFIVTQWLGGPTAGAGVMLAIVLAFLVFAIGRNLRR